MVIIYPHNTKEKINDIKNSIDNSIKNDKPEARQAALMVGLESLVRLFICTGISYCVYMLSRYKLGIGLAACICMVCVTMFASIGWSLRIPFLSNVQPIYSMKAHAGYRNIADTILNCFDKIEDIRNIPAEKLSEAKIVLENGKFMFKTNNKSIPLEQVYTNVTIDNEETVLSFLPLDRLCEDLVRMLADNRNSKIKLKV